nr:scopoletin glucosyltransferase-like [Ziziphus jujuba var. spinosa]
MYVYVSVCKQEETCIDDDDDEESYGFCLKWLDSKKPSSVVCVCLGCAEELINDAQIRELAMDLEASGQDFIRIVFKQKHDEEDWIPKGFEKRMEGKGLIVRGIPTQAKILNHETVGGFVTHCGWTSTIEGVCAVVPIVTWPITNNSFYIEKLTTKIIGIGIGVSAQKWGRFEGLSMKNEETEKGVGKIMVAEEGDEIRNRVKALGEMAKRAIEEGGSTYVDLNAFLEELKLRKMAHQ